MLKTLTSSFFRTFTTDVVKRSKIRVPANIRDYIDFSRVPRINPTDITERVSRGSGPGGQAAATTNYAVTLTHVPTHVVVRCEESRSVEQNRIKAKEKLLAAVDDHLNKEESVSAQVKRIEKIRKERKDAKRKQKREEKLKAKLEQEGLKEDNLDSSQSENSVNEEILETRLKVDEDEKP